MSSNDDRRHRNDVPTDEKQSAKRARGADSNDEERRHLRSQLRKVGQQIIAHTEEIQDAATDRFGKLRAENNQLSDQIDVLHHSGAQREMVLDAGNVNELSHGMAKQADKLLHVLAYDPAQLSAQLRAKFRYRGQFHWKVLGDQAGVCFNKVPAEVTFLSGPLEQDHAVRLRRKPRVRPERMDDVVEEKPEDVQTTSSDRHTGIGELQIHQMRDILQKECEQAGWSQLQDLSHQLPPEQEGISGKEFNAGAYGEVDGLSFVLNGNSFTQTVENIFNLSFFVKEGEVEMNLRDDGVKLKVLSPEEQEKQKKNPCRQTITSLNMREWRQLCDFKGIGSAENVIPNRCQPTRILNIDDNGHVELNGDPDYDSEVEPMDSTAVSWNVSRDSDASQNRASLPARGSEEESHGDVVLDGDDSDDPSRNRKSSPRQNNTEQLPEWDDGGEDRKLAAREVTQDSGC
jgi:hypothetical protein